MIKKLLYFIFILFLTTSCVTNYYFVNLEEDTPIYEKANDEGEAIVVVPRGYSAHVASSTKKYRKIKWKNYKGWVVNPNYTIETTSSYSNNPKSTTYKIPSTASSSGGPVQVKGYYRKNGTYVKPHTRSAPTRK